MLGSGWVQSHAFFQSLNQTSPSITGVSVDTTRNSSNQSVGSSNDADIGLPSQLPGPPAPPPPATIPTTR
ncbi:MAG: hypothetical protein WCF17_09060 [Terracidiphilus sp.]